MMTTEIPPKYQCPSCHRGVLNRAADCCLYCGAKLPASVRLDAKEIAARNEQQRREAERHGPGVPASGDSVTDLMSNGIDLAGAIGDLW